MRIKDSGHDTPRVRAGKGRAVLVGLGLDDAAGHIRYTRSPGCELLGGSEATHEAMLAKAMRIREELAGLGYSLDAIGRDQIDEVRRVVDRLNGE